MNLFKRIRAWEKAQWEKSETRLAVGMAVGLLIGLGTGNVGLGLVLGISLGVAASAGYKNK